MSLAEDLNFDGQRVLVTGAANGFGAAIAREFAACGAALSLADIEEEPLRAVGKELGSTSVHVYDQSKIGSVTSLAQAVGDVDVLINNAGILVAKPLLE